MKCRKNGFLILFLMLLLLSACGLQSDSSELTNGTVPSAAPEQYSFEGTTFFYDGTGHALKSITGIESAIPVGDKIVVTGHAGPKNGIYFIFDTASKSFTAELMGHHLVWHDDDITTAVYAYWSDVCAYDGTVIKSYGLPENAWIYDLVFSDDCTKLTVTIACDDGTAREDIIELG